MKFPAIKHSNIICLVFSIAASLFAMEIALTWLDFPPSGPFLQEFYAPPYFKLMCYDKPPSSGYDFDLRDEKARAYFSELFGNYSRAFDLNREKTPYAVSVNYNSSGFRESEFKPK